MKSTGMLISVVFFCTFTIGDMPVRSAKRLGLFLGQ